MSIQLNTNGSKGDKVIITYLYPLLSPIIQISKLAIEEVLKETNMQYTIVFDE